MLNDRQERQCSENTTDFSNIRAVFVNTSLKKRPEESHTRLDRRGGGPAPSYGDELEDGTRAGFDNDFTQRNTTIMTWNLMHLARMLKDAGGYSNHGNDRTAWDAGYRFDHENPEHRA